MLFIEGMPGKRKRQASCAAKGKVSSLFFLVSPPNFLSFFLSPHFRLPVLCSLFHQSSVERCCADAFYESGERERGREGGTEGDDRRRWVAGAVP